ncbi:porin family protein [Larkinella rosea]|uniref:PorT family protein n=1 Tax=Larkinella rosea TaxID=2025312 RepID=A0A3P1C0Q4_9BACT|nr:porin family protein [Larkinella rosea]RRB06842.1 PorT family protein [Larkinella rosea]
MKGNTFILYLLFWLIGSVSCQAQSIKTLRFGMTGGVNAGLIKKDHLGLQNILWRYKVGITVEKRFHKAMALVGEITYSRQGETVNADTYTIQTGTIKDTQIINFDYVAMPIMLRFRPRSERVFLAIGGQFGYLIDSKFYFASAPDRTTPFAHTNKLDAGLIGGVGFRLGRHLVADLKYFHGMKPILANFTAPDPQTGVPTYYRREGWYNRVFSLNLTYYL